MRLSNLCSEGLDAVLVSINIAVSKCGALLPAEVILGEGALALLGQHSLHARRPSPFGIEC